ncbi:MAG: WxcM-like domain-containing protein [Ignavibacteria bacterium]|nr:WxcM-like domain-containing protein [Ignavibacteria bacterium]
MIHSNVYDATIVQLPINHKDKGNLTSVNNYKEIPFKIKRIYYLYDVPGGISRGGHAHKELQQFIVSASGSFDLVLDDTRIKRTITLNRPYFGVLLPPGLWRELNNFSSGAICLVLASDIYKEEDYIREYFKFKQYKNGI